MSINSTERIIGYIFFRDHYCSWPGRHSKSLCGKPVYYWTFKAALESVYLEKIVVWTEVKAALQMARDMSSRFISIERSLSECREPEWVNGKSIYSNIHRRQWCCGQGEVEAEKILGFKPTMMIYLDASSCMQTGQDIDRLVETYFSRDATVIFSALKIPHAVYFRDKHFVYKGFALNVSRQDFLLIAYTPIGSILYKIPRDLGREKMWLIEISFENSINIHNQKDLELAEFYMRKRLDKQNKDMYK